MGFTRFLGPVYGAKSLLFFAHLDSAAAGATTEILEIDVPATENWVVTNAHAWCTATGNAGAIDVLDDGTSVLPSTITLAANDSANKTVTADAGEDEGKTIAASSAVTITCTVGTTTAAADVTVHVYGYIRRLPIS